MAGKSRVPGAGQLPDSKDPLVLLTVAGFYLVRTIRRLADRRRGPSHDRFSSTVKRVNVYFDFLLERFPLRNVVTHPVSQTPKWLISLIRALPTGNIAPWHWRMDPAL